MKKQLNRQCCGYFRGMILSSNCVSFSLSFLVIDRLLFFSSLKLLVEYQGRPRTEKSISIQSLPSSTFGGE